MSIILETEVRSRDTNQRKALIRVKHSGEKKIRWFIEVRDAIGHATYYPQLIPVGDNECIRPAFDTEEEAMGVYNSLISSFMKEYP